MNKTKTIILSGLGMITLGAYWAGNQYLTKCDHAVVQQHIKADRTVVHQRPYLLSVYFPKQNKTYNFTYTTAKSQKHDLIDAVHAQKKHQKFTPHTLGKITSGKVINQATMIDNNKQPNMNTNLANAKKLSLNFNRDADAKLTINKLDGAKYDKDYHAPKAPKHNKKHQQADNKPKQKSSASSQHQESQKNSSTSSTSQPATQQNNNTPQKKVIYVRKPVSPQAKQ